MRHYNVDVFFMLCRKQILNILYQISVYPVIGKQRCFAETTIPERNLTKLDLKQVLNFLCVSVFRHIYQQNRLLSRACYKAIRISCLSEQPS